MYAHSHDTHIRVHMDIPVCDTHVKVHMEHYTSIRILMCLVCCMNICRMTYSFVIRIFVIWINVIRRQMIIILDIHMHIAMSHIHMHIPCLVFVWYTCTNETCLIWNMHVSSIRAYFLCLDMHYKWDIAICMSAYVFNVHYKWDIAICMCAYVFNM